MMTADLHRRWLRLLAGLVMLAAFWALPARHAEAAVTCSATMTNLVFTDVDLVSGVNMTASATMNYTCTNDQNSARVTRLCLNIGDGSASIASGGGHWNPRILRDPSNNELNVQFYQGAGATIWGSTTQPIPDAYDVIVNMPVRVNNNTPSVSTGSFTLRGVISTGQAAMPNGIYTSSFAGNHTALRYTTPGAANTTPGDCNSATTDGGTFAFTVTANVVKSCFVTADPMDFGTVDGLVSAANIDAQTSIYVTCSRPTAYRVLLIPLNGSGTTTGSSVMKGLTYLESVPYQLYQNAGRTTQWGNQTNNTPTGTGTGASQTLTVYGRVQGLPNVRPDTYRDTVTVNVTY